MLKCIPERKYRFLFAIKLARCVPAINGSQIDNDWIFPAAGVVSKNRKNRIRVHNMNSIMYVDHNHLNIVISKDSSTITTVLSGNRTK